jgi:hypothetical protein
MPAISRKWTDRKNVDSFLSGQRRPGNSSSARSEDTQLQVESAIGPCDFVTGGITINASTKGFEATSGRLEKQAHMVNARKPNVILGSPRA